MPSWINCVQEVSQLCIQLASQAFEKWSSSQMYHSNHRCAGMRRLGVRCHPAHLCDCNTLDDFPGVAGICQTMPCHPTGGLLQWSMATSHAQSLPLRSPARCTSPAVCRSEVSQSGSRTASRAGLICMLLRSLPVERLPNDQLTLIKNCVCSHGLWCYSHPALKLYGRVNDEDP